MKHWESLFEAKLASLQGDDPSHDLLHFKRVVKTAKELCKQEGAIAEVVIPAAWLHDFIVIPKNDPRRSQASRLSAEAASEFLKEVGYPTEYISAICHAIETHSFSANITPETIEAKIVQDADRLDGLGAIGIARCFTTAGLLRRPYYSADDPFCVNREPNDQEYTVDHFYRKLFKTADTLQTASGKKEGTKRAERMRVFLSNLESELN